MKIWSLIFGFAICFFLIWISKWLVLLSVLLISAIIRKSRQPLFMCPRCELIQQEHIVLSRKLNSQISHGRLIKTGRLDRRYNTRYNTSETIDFGVVCKSCQEPFKTTRNF